MSDPDPGARKGLPGLGRFVVPLAAFLAVRAFAFAQADPVGARESAFLALVAGGVLAAIAALAPRPAREVGATALLVLASVWVVEYGPHRGAWVVAILAAGLATATWRALARGGEREPAPGFWVGLAMGLQILMRVDLLLPPLADLRTLVSVLALPAVAGGSLWLLARRFGRERALLAGAAAVVLSPGWNVTATMALLSLAAGALAGDRQAARRRRRAALAVLLVPVAWSPLLGAVLALGGLALVLRGRATIAVAAGAAFLGAFAAHRPLGGVLELAALGLLTVPLLLAAPEDGRLRAALGLVLGLTAAAVGQGPEALCGAAALAALGLPAAGAAGRLQQVWAGFLLVAATLLAGYPWCRPLPLESVLELLGGRSPGYGAVLVLALGSGLGLALDRRPPAWLRPGWTAAGLIAGAVLLAMPHAAAVPVDFVPTHLDAAHKVWREEVTGAALREVVVDSHLVHAAKIAAGTVVGRVRLLDDDRKTIREWPLVVGESTGEWAANRPDLVDRSDFSAPSPWLSGISPNGRFFSRRFRARFRLERPAAVRWVSVERTPRLPPAIWLTIDRVELR